MSYLKAKLVFSDENEINNYDNLILLLYILINCTSLSQVYFKHDLYTCTRRTGIVKIIINITTKCLIEYNRSFSCLTNYKYRLAIN